MCSASPNTIKPTLISNTTAHYIFRTPLNKNRNTHPTNSFDALNLLIHTPDYAPTPTNRNQKPNAPSPQKTMGLSRFLSTYYLSNLLLPLLYLTLLYPMYRPLSKSLRQPGYSEYVTQEQEWCLMVLGSYLTKFRTHASWDESITKVFMHLKILTIGERVFKKAWGDISADTVILPTSSLLAHHSPHIPVPPQRLPLAVPSLLHPVRHGPFSPLQRGAEDRAPQPHHHEKPC